MTRMTKTRKEKLKKYCQLRDKIKELKDEFEELRDDLYEDVDWGTYSFDGLCFEVVERSVMRSDSTKMKYLLKRLGKEIPKKKITYMEIIGGTDE